MNRIVSLSALAAFGALLGVAIHFDFPLCPMASSFGIPCPGCGLTRATLAMLHGDVRGALLLHPLVWLLTPLFVLFAGSGVIELVRSPESGPWLRSPIRWSGRAFNIAAIGLLALTLGVWVLRFQGYFGGPAPVTRFGDWLAARR